MGAAGVFVACVFTLLIHHLVSAQISRELQNECQAEINDWAVEMPHANGPLRLCSNLSAEWIECESVTQLKADNTTKVCPFRYL